MQKEDARLARMPLEGGAVFVNREVNAKVELRDKKRVYLTIFRETTEAEYEVDGC